MPVVQQIIPGNIRLVSDRDERRQSKAEGVRPIDDRQPERPALRQKSDSALRRHPGGERGIERAVRARVQQAHAVRTDQTHTGVATDPEELGLSLSTGVADLAESSREHYQGAHALPRADRKSTRLNSSHSQISYAVFCLKKKKK